jgi:hypothetical protein
MGPSASFRLAGAADLAVVRLPRWHRVYLAGGHRRLPWVRAAPRRVREHQTAIIAFAFVIYSILHSSLGWQSEAVSPPI